MVAYKKMVVIFVDLLGTKNNTRFEDKYFIHRTFHEEVRANEKRNLNHVIYDRKIYSFSDCAYFFYYYKDGIEDNRKNDMELINIAMYNTTVSLLNILSEGYLVRGGIAFGDAYFDELGFFGPAVEEAYELECKYADVPIVALSPKLGEIFYEWEENNTDMDIVNLLMTSRPMLVEKYEEKYFLNIFYQLEGFSSTLNLEHESVELNDIKNTLNEVILRDKKKYKDTNTNNSENKSTIYQKLEWMEEYLKTKHNHLNPDVCGGGIGMVLSDH